MSFKDTEEEGEKGVILFKAFHLCSLFTVYYLMLVLSWQGLQQFTKENSLPNQETSLAVHKSEVLKQPMPLPSMAYLLKILKLEVTFENDILLMHD